MNLSCGTCRSVRPFSGDPLKCDTCGWVLGEPRVASQSSGRVHATPPIFKRNSVYYKDAEYRQAFYDHKAAAVLWRDKQRTDHPLRASLEEGALALVRFVGVALIFTLGVLLWQQSEVSGLRSHDELTTLASGPWSNGEYKDCTSLNFKDAKILMTCGGVFGVEGKVFKIRFYGLTRFEDKPKSFESNWQCRKNGDADPAITCEIKK